MSAIFRTVVAVSLVASALAASPARSQDYPNQPVRMVVPFPAGGGADVVARIVAQPLAAQLGQAVVSLMGGDSGLANCARLVHSISVGRRPGRVVPFRERRYDFIATVLRRFGYRRLGQTDKGVVLGYL